MTTVDLHMHSTVSDGTDDPMQIVKKVHDIGIKTFSLTDHDNFMYTDLIAGYAAENGLRYIRGIEFSCRTGKICHILGYNYDAQNADIIALTQKKMQMQKDKMTARINQLNEKFGIVFSAEDLKWLDSNNRAGKPHLAQLIIKNGYAADKDEAFAKYLSKIHTKSENLSPDEAAEAIHRAGGIVVWAHPLGGEGETHLTPEKFAEEYEIVAKGGIDGIECWYSRYNEDEVKFLLDFAEKHNLLVSGGSDYHGKNKDISLGELNCFGKSVTEDMLTVLNRI